MKDKKYRITAERVSVVTAVVIAHNPDEALEKYDRGEFEGEVIESLSSDPDDVTDVERVKEDEG